jgi:hypothetical protein
MSMVVVVVVVEEKEDDECQKEDEFVYRAVGFMLNKTRKSRS